MKISNNSTVKVYIIDDHPLWSNLLAEILNSTNEFRVVGTATEAATGLKFLGKNAVDLLLVDLALPGMSGIEILNALGQKKSKTKVVVFSGLGSNEAIATAMVRGACAYVEKTANAAELLGTLRDVMRGGFPLSLRMSEVVRELVHKSIRMRLLSGQDLQVFRLLATHTPPKEIADKLGVSVSGIYKVQRKIYAHLGVSNAASLAAIAATYGMIPASSLREFSIVEAESRPAPLTTVI
jgi:DNA-binding NarL/FixJ family response regulator